MKNLFPYAASCLAAALLLQACTPSNNPAAGEWHGSLGDENGVVAITNPAEPVFGELTLELEEDLRIGGDNDYNSTFHRIEGLAVGADGSILILDAGNHRIQKFGPKGGFTVTYGREGQGPGEFDRLSSFFAATDGSVYAVDGMRIQKFAAEGDFLKSVSLTNRISDFLIAPDESIFGVENRNTEQGRGQALVKLDAEGKTPADIAVFSSVAAVDQRDEGRIMRVVILHGYNARLSLYPGPNNSFVYGFPDEYAIHRCGSDGTPDLVIRKQETPVPVRQAEKDRIISNIMENAVVRNRSIREDVVRQGCQFPVNRPFFSDLVVDETGRIFVLRPQSPLEEDAPRKLDVFSQEGHFLQQVALPFRPLAIRGGRLYHMFEDEDTGEITIRRQIILNWEQIKSGLL